MVFTHQTVIMLFRYVLDNLDEKTLLTLDNGEELVNTGVTTYALRNGRLVLEAVNDSSHLPAEETTAAPDRSVAPR